ncbi:MAG TPA: AmmeMemoRadiSam system protein B [Casimicrobiaceae bacterium]|nr:AmmeMemoRadiSam system protein B [Casimicrobiaceae bacterium]
MDSLNANAARTTVRPPAVAGLFYPASTTALEASIEDALALARGVSLPRPKALIVPHAGYVYSGPIAAQAYAMLREHAESISRVILLGPCHRAPVRGLALPDVDAFETPLGRVPLDADAIASIADLPQVVRFAAAHAHEHSLEVQLPFLQRVLADFRLVPLAVGDATAEEVAAVIERLWGGPETLIVISSDLSHYLAYDVAQAIDGATARDIVGLNARLDHEQACGATPLSGLLTVAKRRGLVATLLDLRNSGDTAGDKSRVVGYGAFALHEPDASLHAFDDTRGDVLLGVARSAIEETLGGNAPVPQSPEWLREPRATFVTLRKEGALRGCIGSLEGRRTLGDDVAANAKAAALSDPRFPPMTLEELANTTIEVSLLSEPMPIAFSDRADLMRQLVPGLDGVVLSSGMNRATFLPQVWASVASPDEFIDELLRKAGLPKDFALERGRIARYRVRKFCESSQR